MSKCTWAHSQPIAAYHDNEHGIFPANDTALFELLTLEIFQPGLSFNIVLTKREGLRQYFHNYNLKAICTMDESAIVAGLNNPQIIRHKQKIKAIITNAQLINSNKINLTNYLFETIDYRFGPMQVGPLLAKQMKKDGFKFIGPSVATSLLEAVGLLNDHAPDCDWRAVRTNIVNYQTKFGLFTYCYQDYTITESILRPDCNAPTTKPSNSFELFLKYHLDNYFNHQIYNFKLNLKQDFTPFQSLVYDAICNVPFGTTQTYGDIAYTIGSGAFRAVGAACSKSNFALFIPAHRIVASTGIGGYQNQIELKRMLLQHEGITQYDN